MNNEIVLPIYRREEKEKVKVSISPRRCEVSTLYWMNQHSFPRLLEQIHVESVRLRE